jgi:predicted ATPase with chaperone activity
LSAAGHRARPSEISLAHYGVLFLDELPEFQPQVLHSLRQPLETGEVATARANHRVVYPARFQLVAAMTPCRCGHASEPGFTCNRQPNARCIAQYQARLSGPLLERIDLHVEVPAIAAANLMLPSPAEGSLEVARCVAAARERQVARYAMMGLPGLTSNAAAPANVIESIALPDSSARRPDKGSIGPLAFIGARVSPDLKACPHDRRSRRRRKSCKPACFRGADLPGRHHQAIARGVSVSPPFLILASGALSQRDCSRRATTLDVKSTIGTIRE